MSALAVLIPVTLAMGLVGLAAFVWSLGAGQYEDMTGAAERLLLDDDTPPRASPSPTEGTRADLTTQEASR